MRMALPLPDPASSPESPVNRAVLEISLASAIELTQLGLGTMIVQRKGIADADDDAQ